MPPLVSIVTPSLNQAHFLERTILSLKNQRYSHIQHIIVDGGSTDGSQAIIASHEGTYDMTWLSEPDSGMYDAINKGLALARGDILAYLNSDDYYLPWTLERVVDEFARHPEAGVLSGDVLSVYEEQGTGRLRLLPPFRAESMQRAAFLPQPSTFWRAAVTRSVGNFDASLKIAGDAEYWLRAGKKFGFRHVPEILSVESLHDSNKRSADPPRLFAELNEVRSRYMRASKMRPLILASDVAYRAAFNRISYAMFGLAWLRWKQNGKTPGRWRSFITEEPFPIAGWSMLAATVVPKGLLKPEISSPTAMQFPDRHGVKTPHSEAA